MRRLLLAGLLLALFASYLALTGGAVAPPARTRTVQLNGHTFTLPAGFEIEVAARAPLVKRPIVADFDEEGRLYVADSSGSNEPVAEQLRKKPHRIVRLEATRGDGVFDKSTVFADKMMFPEGVMWLGGSLYVAAPPSIWKLTDSKGKGVADQRREWFAGKTLTGCANDLHGPYLGPDGWVYWCKGAFAQQTYPRPGKKPFVTRAAHIFRCRPDGSGIEPVMTGGMDNPVDVVFTPGGERIFTTTFFQHPGGGLRDGLIHAVYGGIYGKDHSVIHDPAHKWSGPGLMPVLTHLGAAAPCGLVRYQSRAFGPAYQDNLFAALFNMQKVTRHVLEAHGSTFKTRDEDFLVSSNRDFHPTDVIEDADGSLLVVDTGGWYKLCCPTSQLHKPDVLGAIYRIRKKGAPRIADPRGRKIDWVKSSPAALARLLGDARPAVRRRAVETLAVRGAKVVSSLGDVLRSARSVEARRNAVWTATRIDHRSARAAVRQALADTDESVRQVALHSVSLWRDRAAGGALLKILRGASLPNRRAAAEALGRIGDSTAVAALLAALGKPADRVLEHSLTFALIEIADAERTSAGLESKEPRIQRAALIGLDQMDQGGLATATVQARLTATDPRLKEAAWWIAGRHPEWGGALAGFFRRRLGARDLPQPAREELVGQMAKFAGTEAIGRLLAEQLKAPALTQDGKRLVLRAMARARLKKVPDAWIAGLVRILGGEGKLVGEAVTTARALPLVPKGSEKLAAKLLDVAGNSGAGWEVRLTALAAVPGGLAEVKPKLFAYLRARVAGDQPVLSRSLAAEVLSRARLSGAQLTALTETLKTVGPMEVERLLDAFARSTDDVVGYKLLAALKSSPVRSSLRAETLRPRLAKYSPKVRKAAEGLYAALEADAAKQRAQLEALLAKLKGGDVRRGQAVFNSARAACSSCHAIGYLGGKVGPDLTHVGKIRSERDLLEAIVFPSASLVRSYEPVLVTTRKGKVFNGLLRKDTAEEVVLVLGADQQVRIARGEIEDMQPSKVSIMPAGLDKQLTRRELADLVAFLKACK
jgi:putative membrane-bound dehydrogenase-like protein